MATISRAGISSGSLVQAEHVLNIINALDSQDQTVQLLISPVATFGSVAGSGTGNQYLGNVLVIGLTGVSLSANTLYVGTLIMVTSISSTNVQTRNIYDLEGNNDIVVSAGRVGIRTIGLYPRATLHVNGSISADSISAQSSMSGSYGRFTDFSLDNLTANNITFVSITSVDITTTGNLNIGGSLDVTGSSISPFILRLNNSSTGSRFEMLEPSGNVSATGNWTIVGSLYSSALSSTIAALSNITITSITGAYGKFDSLTSNSISLQAITSTVGNILTLNSTNASLANVASTAITGTNISSTNLTGSNLVSQVSNIANITTTALTATAANIASINSSIDNLANISYTSSTGTYSKVNSLTANSLSSFAITSTSAQFSNVVIFGSSVVNGPLSSSTLSAGGLTSTTLNVNTQNTTSATFNSLTTTQGNVILCQNSGRVGIGTNTPNNTFQVANLINFDDVRTSIFLGYQSGLNNIGTGNTSQGYQSLYSLSSGSHNIAQGQQSLYSLNSGSYNIAQGQQSLYSLSSGSHNIAQGYRSLYSLSSGGSNIAQGYQSLYSLSSGDYNIAIGYNASNNLLNKSYFLNIGNTIYGDLLNNFVSIGTSSTVTHSLFVNGTLSALNISGLSASINSISSNQIFITRPYIKTGANQPAGTITLAGAGSAQLNNTLISNNALILLTTQTGAAANVGSPYVKLRAAGISAWIQSTDVADTSTVGYAIFTYF